ncbi:hypothetical protein KAW38_01060 [Candidatus Micrarchaeota archaeon]|nr:hypothetical protein [Candidatus Micrarchaeota archaeon]
MGKTKSVPKEEEKSAQGQTKYIMETQEYAAKQTAQQLKPILPREAEVYVRNHPSILTGIQQKMHEYSDNCKKQNIQPKKEEIQTIWNENIKKYLKKNPPPPPFDAGKEAIENQLLNLPAEKRMGVLELLDINLGAEYLKKGDKKKTGETVEGMKVLGTWKGEETQEKMVSQAIKTGGDIKTVTETALGIGFSAAAVLGGLLDSGTDEDMANKAVAEAVAQRAMEITMESVQRLSKTTDEAIEKEAEKRELEKLEVGLAPLISEKGAKEIIKAVKKGKEKKEINSIIKKNIAKSMERTRNQAKLSELMKKANHKAE